MSFDPLSTCPISPQVGLPANSNLLEQVHHVRLFVHSYDQTSKLQGPSQSYWQTDMHR